MKKIWNKIKNSILYKQLKTLSINAVKLAVMALIAWSAYLLYLVSGKFLLIIVLGIIVVAGVLSIIEIPLINFVKYLFNKIKNFFISSDKKESFVINGEENKKNFLLNLKKNFFSVFIKNLAIVIIIFTMPIILVKAWNNFYAQKSYLPRVVVKNDAEKKVAFQGMTHVSSSSFYKNILSDITIFLFKGDFVLFREGPGSDRDDEKNISENLKKITDSNLMDTYSFYKIFDICNKNSVSPERPFEMQYTLEGYIDEFLLKDYKDKNIRSDITFDRWSEVAEEIINESPESLKEFNKLEKESKEEIEEVNKKLKQVDWSKFKIDNNQQKIIQEFCFAATHFPVKSFINDDRKEDIIKKIVVDARDKELAEKVQNSKHDRIYVLYGVGHLKGFLNSLKKLDDSWKVTDVSWIPVGKEKEEYSYNLESILDLEFVDKEKENEEEEGGEKKKKEGLEKKEEEK